MKSHLIMVGSELLSGLMLDTNSIYIAEKLNEYGIEIVGKSIVGDKVDDIVQVLKNVAHTVDLVIMSGGLGPTIDDVTRDAVGKFLGKNLILYEDEYKLIESKFRAFGIKKIPERNKRQAMIPDGAAIIQNNAGSAPVFFVDNICCFPGVPVELEETLPRFLEIYSKQKEIKSRLYMKDILVWGLPESELENRILDIVEKEKVVFVEFLVKHFGTIIRLFTDMEHIAETERLKSEIYKRVGDFIFGEDGDRIETLLLKELERKKYSLSIAESCTGGLASATIVNVPRASKYFYEGIVVYDNRSKIQRLGVKEETIEKYGAVSSETVKEMLCGLTTDTGIAISGIAGPDGGTVEKPVGTVIIGIKIKETFRIEQYLFRGDRERIRTRATLTALNLLRSEIAKDKRSS